MKSECKSEQDGTASFSDIEYPEHERATTARPAVGIRVSPTTDPDHLAGSILRAKRADHDVIVYAPAPAPDQIEAVVRQLEVPALWVDRALDVEPVEPVVTFARETGYPGLLVQRDVETIVDFETSTERLRDGTDYLAEVAAEPKLPPEPHVLVGIPAYNEAQAIADVVTDAHHHADEVLVVDDGSDDATVERAQGADATVIEHETNRGYGGALKTIFEEAARVNADLLVIVDADGQHNPAEIPELVDTQAVTDADIVIGSRFADDGGTDAPLYRRVGLGVVNVLTNLSLGVVRSRSWIQDTQSGFRLYTQSAVQSLAADTIGDTMSASTDILYHAHSNDLTVEEVGAEVNYDVEDASNLHPVAHGITLVMNILRTVERERPVLALGVPGFISTLTGIGFGYWTLSNFIATGSFPFGLAIASVFFGLAGLFSAFTAIILHALKQLGEST